MQINVECVSETIQMYIILVFLLCQSCLSPIFNAGVPAFNVGLEFKHVQLTGGAEIYLLLCVMYVVWLICQSVWHKINVCL